MNYSHSFITCQLPAEPIEIISEEPLEMISVEMYFIYSSIQACCKGWINLVSVTFSPAHNTIHYKSH